MIVLPLYLSCMYRPVFVFLFFMCAGITSAQPVTDSLLAQVLASHRQPLFQQVLRDPERYRLQIIYTQINRDRKNNPTFTNHYFHYDSTDYFNPASMVKMPLAFLALEKLQGLKKQAVNRYSTIQFDSSQPWQRPLWHDTSALNGKPTIAHLIKRAFLISENDPYNRLYQFLGQGELNRSLWRKGFTDVRITRQFLGLTPEQNRYTNALRFLDKRGHTLYAQPPLYNNNSFDFSRTIRLGKGYLNRNDSLINEPFDFTMHNTISLGSLQRMLQAVMFPKSVPEQQRFQLSKDDYRFLYQYLSQYPSETPDPKYDTTIFYDSYVKFFFRDSTRRMPEGLRVFNKVGWAYGFLTDVSYVADFENGVEYMLAATLYVNEDQILNDGKYEYETVGWPFLRQLGAAVYNYERERKRKYRPNLSAFRVAYEKRDPADRRPSLKEVDN
jgi:hypothetical protein